MDAVLILILCVPDLVLGFTLLGHCHNPQIWNVEPAKMNIIANIQTIASVGRVHVASDDQMIRDNRSAMLMDPPLPVFKYLAQSYRLHGATTEVLCKFNAEVRRVYFPRNPGMNCYRRRV